MESQAPGLDLEKELTCSVSVVTASLMLPRSINNLSVSFIAGRKCQPPMVAQHFYHEVHV